MLTTPSTLCVVGGRGQKRRDLRGHSFAGHSLRVGKDGKPFTLFETKDVSVQVVRLGPDGALYAATLPSGKVYRLKADATAKQDEASATVVFDLGKLDGGKAAAEQAGQETADRQIGRRQDRWQIALHLGHDLRCSGPALHCHGRPGSRLSRRSRQDRRRAGAVFQERRAAYPLPGVGRERQPDCGLRRHRAWSTGSIPQGKGYVLFEAPRREITSVAVGANGTIYAASVGDKSHNPLPPLPVQGQARSPLPSCNRARCRPPTPAPPCPRAARFTRCTDDQGQAPRKIWAGKDEIVYALAARKDGLLALTGNRGHIFRIAEDGSYADVAHLEAQQGLSLAVPNTETQRHPYRHGQYGKAGSAGPRLKCTNTRAMCWMRAHWRALGGWRSSPVRAGYELLTRTGNVEQPVRGRGDWGWSDWQPLKDGAVASPAGTLFRVEGGAARWWNAGQRGRELSARELRAGGG